MSAHATEWIICELADRGSCLACGTTMQTCAFDSAAAVCCRKCEHGRAAPSPEVTP